MDGRAAAVGLKQRHLAVTGSKREAGERRREAVRTPRGLPPHRPLAELKAAAPSALPAATAPTAADLGREALLVPASEIPVWMAPRPPSPVMASPTSDPLGALLLLRLL